MERARDEGPRPRERSRADGLQEETERTGPSQGSSFNKYGAGDQFNAPGGRQDIQIFYAEMDSRSNDIDTAAQGTCDWLLRHETYTSWASHDRGLLWIKGKPGSGKSMLLRHVLNNAMAMPNTEEGALILSYFFHGRGTELQRTPFGLFRSLLHQLREVSDALSDIVETFQQRCETVGKPGEEWQWHPHELRQFFESSLLKVLTTHPVWLFVDALDECGKENAVKLVQDFETMLQRPQSSDLKRFRICFTCRHYPILDLDGVFEVCVEEENRKDISTFVQDKLASFRRRTSSTIPDFITEHADGVFLWARLVVNQVLDLERKGIGLKKIEAEIRSVPQDLDDLYRELIRHMGPDSLKLIQWICFATRPLSLDELRWAMLVDADCPHRSLYECQSAGDYPSDNNGMKRRVQTLSCGLAEIILLSGDGEDDLSDLYSSSTSATGEDDLSDLYSSTSSIGTDVTPSFDTQVVQFIHQSVKDFFVENGLSALDENLSVRLSTAIWLVTAVLLHYFPIRLLLSQAFPLPIVFAISTFWRHGVLAGTAKPDFPVGIAHHRLSRTCLRYLAMEEIGQLASHKRNDMMFGIHKRDAITSKFPFLHYATASWVAHTKQSNASGVLQEDLLEYFAGPSNTLIERWVCIYRILAIYSNDCPLEGTSLVHVMSRYGVAGALWAILKRADKVSSNIDAKDSDGRTPLWRAAENGHEAVVRLLLDQGAHIDTADKVEGQTPLLLAAQSGRESMVKLLLEKGADIEAKDEGGQTPLLLAAERGHEAIIKLLLDRGAYIKAKDEGGPDAAIICRQAGTRSYREAAARYRQGRCQHRRYSLRLEATVPGRRAGA
ncbi:hypothetical protein IL306_008316 [Fusarium sp. DS 682]|nr:hypothetical protein IL306_008316 [Fusarium sp. DS 682]